MVRLRVRHILYLFATISFYGLVASASLGENDNSVESDRRALNGSTSAAVKISSQKNYTVHEITTANGTSIKEYVSSQGTVFAVTWHGMTHPDLQVLLGVYHGEYLEQENRKERTGRRAHEKLSGANIVVEKQGHMRDMGGRAYLPSSIPEGVSLEEIR